jgi:hypothetical protein
MYRKERINFSQRTISEQLDKARDISLGNRIEKEFFNGLSAKISKELMVRLGYQEEPNLVKDAPEGKYYLIDGKIEITV